MSILRLLRTKRKGDGLDLIIFAVIVVFVLAYFGYITLHF
jgi:flagellar basal body-associated protein FliL